MSIRSIFLPLPFALVLGLSLPAAADPTPEPTPAPTPVETPTPEATPEPTPEATPTPELTPEMTPTQEPTPELTPTPTPTPETTPTPTPTESPTPTPEEETCACAPDEGEPEPTPSPVFFCALNADEENEQEVYKYEGPTTDFTGVQLIWEKVYKGKKCIKQKKFYYCAPCSDLNDEHPSIWIDPATAKFLFQPPYLLGGQKTLGDINFLTLEMGSVGRYVYDLDPDQTNGNFPLAPPASQADTVVQGTSPYGLTPIRTYQIP